MNGFRTTTELAEHTAARLTASQRHAVLAGRIGSGVGRGRGYWPLKHALMDKQLFTVANGCDVLTAWGQMVQRVLIEQERERAR